MVTQLKAKLVIDCRDIVGEGPAWDGAGNRVLWLDNASGIIHQARPDAQGNWGEGRRWNLGRSTGAAVPRAKGGLVVVAGAEVLTVSETGDVATFARIDADPNVVKLNDAKCDPQGRLWAGTYAHDFRPGVGALYRIDPDGSVTTMLKNVGLSNGLDWSPDGATFYYIDSFTASVDAFDFDASRGAISRRRHIVTIPANEGGLDGMTVDREGCLWLAIFGPGEVRRYALDGTQLMRVEVPAPAVSSCAFGAADGGDLFITTASLRIPDPVLPVIGWSVGMADKAAAAPGGGRIICLPAGCGGQIRNAIRRLTVDAPSFDVIIVGAGAAGCVLAGRLSEVLEKRVLLIEAGPDAPAGKEHADIRDPFPVLDSNSHFAWPGLTAETGADPGNGQPRLTLPYLQGYGVGGSSNINGMAVDRGQPEDYNEWRNYGVVGWSWNEVLPYFKKLEQDQDFSGPLHGDSGPIPVRRVGPQNWAPFSKAVGEALERRGYPLIEDFIADFRDGISSVAMNCMPNQRVSASMAYLTSTVRRRPNLTILPNTMVDRLDVSGGRVRSVAVRTNAGPREYQALETILACGTLQSPTVLMRSGIGPGPQLRAVGIEIIRDLPGVGRNLQNHPMIGLVVHLPRAAVQPRENRPWLQNLLRYSSKCEGCSQHDMLAIACNRVAWHPAGRRTGAILVEVHKSYSKGCVELTTADPAIAPRIQFNLLSDSRDFERLVGGLRLALELLADSEVKCVRNEVFLPNGKIVARLAKRSPLNWLQAWAITMVFESESLRQKLLGKATLDVSAFAQDEGALRHLVRLGAQPVYHPCGTCRMGSTDFPEAVVDSDCRVLGVGGLRVVDASIFPTIPSGSLHFPVLMTAEKMADQIKAEWQEKAGVSNFPRN